MELGNQLDTSQGCVIEKKKGLDASQLKIIALVTMLIDHIGAIIIPFLQGYTENMTTFIALEGMMVIMRLVGRISFPIFAFLVVNGFYHTRNRKKYLLRLSIFALISEPFFDIAISGPHSFIAPIATSFPRYGSPPPPAPRRAAPLAISSISGIPSLRIF